MFVSDLSIINYRSFNAFSIELKPKTLIIGENNVGKTNLLSALTLLLNNEIGGQGSKTLKLEDFNYDVLQEFKESIATLAVRPEDVNFPSIHIKITFSDIRNDEEEALVGEWYDDGSCSSASLQYSFYCALLNKTEWVESVRETLREVADGLSPEEVRKAHQSRIDSIDFPISDYKHKIEAGHGKIKPDNWQLEVLKMDYLDALRDAKTELSASNESKLLYRILRNRDGAKYEDIKASADELNRSIGSSDSELSGIKKDISELLDILSLETESSKNRINFNFSRLEVAELLKKINLEYGDKPIAIKNNGLGRNNLLYMALVLSHIQEKFDTPDFRLIAIEEPESHISPILQKHFAENVSGNHFFNEKSNRQVILTTHSTHISSYLDLDNTVILFKDGNELKSHYIFEGMKDNASGRKTKNYLKKWLSATNSVMFFSRRLILVEGIAEKILIPKLFEKHFGTTLEKKNCQVININGVAFRNFLQIVNNGYYIKTSVITDSDSEKKSRDRAPQLEEDFSGGKIKVCISKEPTFEKELISSNTTGTGRTKLKNAITSTRPIKSKSDEFQGMFKVKLKTNDVFDLVEEYKSEFAFNLSTELDKSGDFTIPQYIIEALNFVCKD